MAFIPLTMMHTKQLDCGGAPVLDKPFHLRSTFCGADPTYLYLPLRLPKFYWALHYRLRK